jgi:hypothetical protein
MDQADKPSPERMAKQGNVRDQLTGSDEIDADFLLPGRLEERQGSRPGDMRVRIVLSGYRSSVQALSSAMFHSVCAIDRGGRCAEGGCAQDFR